MYCNPNPNVQVVKDDRLRGCETKIAQSHMEGFAQIMTSAAGQDKDEG